MVFWFDSCSFSYSWRPIAYICPIHIPKLSLTISITDHFNFDGALKADYFKTFMENAEKLIGKRIFLPDPSAEHTFFGVALCCYADLLKDVIEDPKIELDAKIQAIRITRLILPDFDIDPAFKIISYFDTLDTRYMHAELNKSKSLLSRL